MRNHVVALNDTYSVAVISDTAYAPDPLPRDASFTLLLPRPHRIARAERIRRNPCYAAGVVGAFSRPIVLQTADCIPCIAYEQNGDMGGLAHFGYRDLLARVPQRFLRALHGGEREINDFRFIFGPSICTSCYTHKTFLRRIKWYFLRYATSYGGVAKTDGKDSHTFDLTAACIREFERAGVRRAQIAIMPECTHCMLGNSFHYRGKGTLKVTTIVGPHHAIPNVVEQAVKWRSSSTPPTTREE